MTARTDVAARGPVRQVGEVFSRKQVGAFWHLTIVADRVAARARPGMHVSVAVGGPLSAVVGRRSVPVHRVRPSGVYGGTVELVVDPTEPGDAWVASRAPHDRLELVGPLGRGFALPREPVTCALVGVGCQAASLFALAERLRERRCGVHMVLGGAREAELFGVLDARRTAQSVTVATADGSVGIRGEVIGPLAGLLERSRVEVVYAAGPAPALAAVSRVATQHGAWVQALVDVPMPCGTGLCAGCVVPVRGDDGAVRAVRACVEGPVLPGDRVEWDGVR